MFNISKVAIAAAILTAPVLAEAGELAHTASQAVERARARYGEFEFEHSIKLREQLLDKLQCTSASAAEVQEIDAVALAAWDDEEPGFVMVEGAGAGLVLWPVLGRGLTSIIIVGRGAQWGAAHHEWAHHHRGDVPRRVTGWLGLTPDAIKMVVLTRVMPITLVMEEDVNVLALRQIAAELAEIEADVLAKRNARQAQLDKDLAFRMSRNMGTVQGLIMSAYKQSQRIDAAAAAPALAMLDVRETSADELARAFGTYVRREGVLLERFLQRAGASATLATITRHAVEHQRGGKAAAAFTKAIGLDVPREFLGVRFGGPEWALTGASVVGHDGQPSERRLRTAAILDGKRA